MLWSRTLHLVFFVIPLVGGIGVHASHTPIRCPLTHDGKPLRDVGLFEGPPSQKVELMPQPGRFIVPQPPRTLWATLPDYTLGCFYDRSRQDVVTVVLPRSIQICEFPHYPQVECH
jgi:hypothetical protein